MRYIYSFIFIFSLPAFANLEHCMNDARDSGYMLNERPNKNCEDIIREHPNHIEAKSISGKYKAIAYGNMLYLYTYSLNKEVPVAKDMLAGDQTHLRSIKKVWVDEINEKIFILQNGNPFELLTFILHPSNTAPLRHFKSPILNTVSTIKLMDDREELAIMSSKSKAVRFINSGADNVTYKGPGFKPLLLREIRGEDSKLQDPIDVVINDAKKEIYVLDNERILIFDMTKLKEAAPKKVISLPLKSQGAVKIALKSDGFLSVTLANGDDALISLTPEE